MKFNVQRTNQRRGRDLFVHVHPDHRATLKGAWVVVQRTVPGLQERLHAMGKAWAPDALAILGRVRFDPDVPRGVACLDQKLRTALGYDFREDLSAAVVEVEPVQIGWRDRLASATNRILGRRILAVRAQVAFLADVESDLVRMPEDAFALLGCKPGDRVRCVCVAQTESGFKVRSTTRPAYVASSELLENRRAVSSTDLDARYPDTAKVLGVEPDLPGIFVDRDFNQATGAFPMAPLRVERDAGQMLRREIRTAGFLFFIAAIAVVEVLPLPRDWRTLGYASAVALLVTLVVTIASMRDATK